MVRDTAIGKFVNSFYIPIVLSPEGNTRATAVFIIKYLKALGFQVSNDAFSKYSWYFRNALVRANYNDLQNGVAATTKYLELFFENLLMDRKHELKNCQLHLDYTL